MTKAVVVSLLLLGLCFVAARPQEEPNQDNHGAQVFRVTVEDVSSLRSLQALQLNSLLDFWTEPRKLGTVDIMARRWDIPMLKRTLDKLSIKYEIIIADVAEFTAVLVRENEEARTKAGADKKMDWSSYHTYEEIDLWMESLVQEHPTVASLSVIGQSYEGRAMKMLKLSTGGNKPAIFTDGGIHAREWISPAVVTYIINAVLTDLDSSSILDTVDLYFIPAINPDGYAYTWSNNRYWRKTRSVNKNSPCKGADPNRNWDIHWNEGGTSDWPCSDLYAGTAPFSEVEMVAVSETIAALRPIVYLTLHSYSQLWMYPWGWTYDLPDNWMELDKLANVAVTALKAVHGTIFGVGSSANAIYIAAGGSDDWALGVGGSRFAYTVELRDTGRYAFDLPPNQIIPSGEETYAAFKAMVNFIKDNHT